MTCMLKGPHLNSGPLFCPSVEVLNHPGQLGLLGHHLESSLKNFILSKPPRAIDQNSMAYIDLLEHECRDMTGAYLAHPDIVHELI